MRSSTASSPRPADVLAAVGVEVHNPAVLSPCWRTTAPPSTACPGGRASPPAWWTARCPALRVHSPLRRPRARRRTTSSGDNVHFTPGSAAITRPGRRHRDRVRKPDTADYVRYVRWWPGCPTSPPRARRSFPPTCTAGSPDSYRLYLSLLYGEKPVVTGAFTIESFEVMRTCRWRCAAATQRAAREAADDLLLLPDRAPQVERRHQPEPGGLRARGHPGGVHLHAALRLHGAGDAGGHAGAAHRRDAERRRHQPAGRPGRARSLWGGSPAIFDVRYETTPMGAVETMMIDCANAEVGKRLGLPTQGYIALSDAKQLDAQAGLETRHGRDAGGAVGHQQHLGPGHARFRELPEPGEAGASTTRSAA